MRHNPNTFVYVYTQMDKQKQKFAEGITCLMNNEYQQAHEIFMELLNQNEDPCILHNLGLSYECIGNFDKAIETYETNIEKHPEHILSYLCLSNCNLYINKLYKAICWLKQAEDVCGETVQGDILFSEASFLAGNPSEGCARHARALSLIQEQQQTNHHVQCYTDYGDGLMHFYSWIEHSYISHGRKPTVEFLSSPGKTWKKPPMLVLINAENAEQVMDQGARMSDEEKSQMYLVAQDPIVERMLGPSVVVDARVVSSAPSQSDVEFFTAYALDVAHVILQEQKHIQAFRIPFKDTCITIDGSVDATLICPMLLRSDDSNYNIFALSGLQ
jgi:tetratricopeptide (TPR) repeat protein